MGGQRFPEISRTGPGQEGGRTRMERRWRIELFGGLRAVLPGGSPPPACGGHVVTRFGTRRAATLLAYLACHPGRAHPRELLVELLWPEEDPEATRARFRQTLAGLRRALDLPGAPHSGVFLAGHGEIRLRSEAVETDVGEFEAALRGAAGEPLAARATLLARAAELYRDDLLPGFYEEWVQPERQRLQDACLHALVELAEALALLGDLPGAVERARRAVAIDPLREETRVGLIRLLAAAGRRADALRQYRELDRLLKAELNLSPGTEAQALAREIEAGGREEVWTSGRVNEWTSGSRNILRPLVRSSARPFVHSSTHPGLEPPGGAVPLGSQFYVERPADAEFGPAIVAGESIVLVKGAGQVGKTSLLARGLEAARQAGMRVAITDFQALSPEQLASTEALFLHLAERLAEAIELEPGRRESWDPRRGWNVNFQRFMQLDALGCAGVRLVWAMDGVDRLFGLPFASQVFALFRSWHNARSLSPAEPWSRLTLAITYATEAHLFITDLNQSPFNVGMRLDLADFTPEQVADLNRRHAVHSQGGSPPLRDSGELGRFFALVGGHPYLVRRGLYEMAAHGRDLAAIEAAATRSDGPFFDHLRRMSHALAHDEALCAAMRVVHAGGPCPTREGFYRLQAAGLFAGDTPEEARPRCELYRLHLLRELE